VTWWTDAAGAVTIYQLDASSRVTAVTDPLGHVTHVWYDEYGCVTACVDPLGRLTRYAYDERGNLTCITRPDGSQARARYDEANLLASTLITSAGTVRYRHDRQGRVIARHRTQISHPPATWSYRWDADDRLTAVSTPDGSTWRYRYDPLGRRIAKQRFDPSGAPAEETTFTWDGAVLAEESAGAPELGRRRRLTWDYRPGTFTALTQSERVSASDAPQQVIDERFYAIIADQVGMPAELIAPDGTVVGHQQHTLWGGTLWRPLGLAPAPNPHAYVPNPLIQTDPLGLMSCAPKATRAFLMKPWWSAAESIFPSASPTPAEQGSTRQVTSTTFLSRTRRGGRLRSWSRRSQTSRSACRMGSIRAAGGSIEADTEGHSYHCIIGGCTPEQFSELFTPTIKNPRIQ
jgi:YD repeat-containing protein